MRPLFLRAVWSNKRLDPISMITVDDFRQGSCACPGSLSHAGLIVAKCPQRPFSGLLRRFCLQIRAQRYYFPPKSQNLLTHFMACCAHLQPPLRRLPGGRKSAMGLYGECPSREAPLPKTRMAEMARIALRANNVRNARYSQSFGMKTDERSRAEKSAEFSLHLGRRRWGCSPLTGRKGGDSGPFSGFSPSKVPRLEAKSATVEGQKSYSRRAKVPQSEGKSGTFGPALQPKTSREIHNTRSHSKIGKTLQNRIFRTRWQFLDRKPLVEAVFFVKFS